MNALHFLQASYFTLQEHIKLAVQGLTVVLTRIQLTGNAIAVDSSNLSRVSQQMECCLEKKELPVFRAFVQLLRIIFLSLLLKQLS